MSSSKKKLARCLSEFINWGYSQSCWYFWPSFVNCCSSNLISALVQPSPPPPILCLNKYSILYCIVLVYYTRIQCVRGRYGVLCRRSYRSVFLDDDILLCLLWVLSFYDPTGLTPSSFFAWTWSDGFFSRYKMVDKYNDIKGPSDSTT